MQLTATASYVALPDYGQALAGAPQLQSTFESSPPESTASLENLRYQAMVTDRSATSQICLADLWHELAQGKLKVRDSFFTDTRCFLIVSPTSAATRGSLDRRRLDILESVLSGAGQKRIAIDLELAPSTVALNARLALEWLGVRCRPSRAHPLLMLAAKANQDGDSRAIGALSFVQSSEGVLRIVSAPRPDRGLAVTLPPAELSVARSLVEGACYQDIAQQRGTSTRTIANQITAVFRRLKVSGRSELLLRLFAEQLREQH